MAGMCVARQGACMGCVWQGGHAWQGVCVAGGHTVSEQVVRILLECILISHIFIIRNIVAGR